MKGHLNHHKSTIHVTTTLGLPHGRNHIHPRCPLGFQCVNHVDPPSTQSVQHVNHVHPLSPLGVQHVTTSSLLVPSESNMSSLSVSLTVIFESPSSCHSMSLRVQCSPLIGMSPWSFHHQQYNTTVVVNYLMNHQCTYAHTTLGRVRIIAPLYQSITK
jgi:hypothetical protein